MNRQRTFWFVFAVAVFLGAGVWFLSPLFTGLREPWDAQSGYYYYALLVAGFLPGCLSTRRFWSWALGVWLGQVAAFVVLFVTTPAVGANLWPVGLLFLTFCSLLSLAGASSGAALHVLLFRFLLRRTKVA
jgi:hypothetical protein